MAARRGSPSMSRKDRRTPTSRRHFSNPDRADELYVGIRQVTAVTATVVDWDHMTGTVSIPEIDSKYAIDSHVIGCELVDGGECTTTAPSGSLSQSAFVDNPQPVFTPSGSSNFESLRIPADAGASCETVRTLLP
jgi:hypothetical protein